MGLWLAVGKAALKVGVPALAKLARGRLATKEAKARVESYKVEDGLFRDKAQRAQKRDERERAKAAR